jgi:hypothetical protein
MVVPNTHELPPLVEHETLTSVVGVHGWWELCIRGPLQA